MRNVHRLLPRGWVWTRRAFGPDFCLFAARDTRWNPKVPDIVDSSEEGVIRYAEECEAGTP